MSTLLCDSDDIIGENETYSFETIHDDLKFDNEEPQAEDETDESSINDIISTIQLKQLSIFTETLSNNNNHEWDKSMSLDLLIKLVLSKLGLHKSLEEFQKEWNTMQVQGKLSEETIASAQNIIHQTDSQAGYIDHLQNDIFAVNKHAEKVLRQRDELRLHNHRLKEDNRKLICQIRYLKTLSQSYEPAIEESKKRYEFISKNNTAIKLERDRLKSRIQELEDALTFLPMK